MVKAEHWAKSRTCLSAEHAEEASSAYVSASTSALPALLELVTAAAATVIVLPLLVVVLVLRGIPLPLVLESVLDFTTSTSKSWPHLKEKSENMPTFLFLLLPL